MEETKADKYIIEFIHELKELVDKKDDWTKLELMIKLSWALLDALNEKADYKTMEKIQ